MLLPQPHPGRWELHGRLLGAEFRIRPLFWVSCVLVGVIYYQDPRAGGLAAFCFWLAAVLTSFVVHELGHVLVARFFGVVPHVVLSGLGGQVYGLDQLTRGRRVLVLLAGLLGNLLILALLWAVTAYPSVLGQLDEDQLSFVGNAVEMLMLANALWVLLNVLPLWPLDGGRIAVEIGETLLGRRGRTVALLLSLLVCVLMTIYVLAWMRLNLTNRFDERYRVHLIFFGVMSLYCYAFWLTTFRALWGEEDDKVTR